MVVKAGHGKRLVVVEEDEDEEENADCFLFCGFRDVTELTAVQSASRRGRGGCHDK